MDVVSKGTCLGFQGPNITLYYYIILLLLPFSQSTLYFDSAGEHPLHSLQRSTIYISRMTIMFFIHMCLIHDPGSLRCRRQRTQPTVRVRATPGLEPADVDKSLPPPSNGRHRSAPSAPLRSAPLRSAPPRSAPHRTGPSTTLMCAAVLRDYPPPPLPPPQYG